MLADDDKSLTMCMCLCML